MYQDTPGALEVERTQERTVWIDVRQEDASDSEIFAAAFNTGVDTLIVELDQLDEFKYPSGISLATVVTDDESLPASDDIDIVISENPEVLRTARADGTETAISSYIDDQETLDATVSNLSEHQWVDYGLVTLEDETNIPLELIIAECQDEDITVLKSVDTAEQAGVAFGVMDVGIDGVSFTPDDVGGVYDIASMSGRVDEQIELEEIEISNVEHIGMGTRVCVDTTSIMSKQEGMLVGSKSMGGIFVCSETHPLPYMDLRPFRVNAGAAHSYIWGPDDQTNYLSELESGREVLCVDTDGNARTVSVGRSKVEERPLLLIEATHGDRQLNVILQDDWHVRVMGSDGEPINITELRPGDKVLGYVCEPGRHVGVKVSEDIMET